MEKNIRANCISPGGIKNKSQSKKFISEYKKLTPLGRLANLMNLMSQSYF